MVSFEAQPFIKLKDALKLGKDEGEISAAAAAEGAQNGGSSKHSGEYPRSKFRSSVLDF